MLRRALIHHEDKPGMFKFVWYFNDAFHHHSFICANNGFFADGNIHETLTGLLCYMQGRAPELAVLQEARNILCRLVQGNL